jgi:hypothetical protein
MSNSAVDFPEPGAALIIDNRWLPAEACSLTFNLVFWLASEAAAK